MILATIYVIVVPKEGAERFSEFYILGKNQTAADYPDLILPAENYPMYIGDRKPRIPHYDLYNRDMDTSHGI